jgi:ankyrin repeat protein
MIEKFMYHVRNDNLIECEKILKSCNAEDLKEILNHRDGLGNTLLLDYSHENNFPVCKLLIDYGANVNAYNVNGKSSLINAAINQDEKLIELLLNNHADANYARTDRFDKKIGSNALMTACEKDNLNIIKSLLNVTDINYINDLGHSAFMYACQTPSEVTGQKLAALLKYPEIKTENHDFMGKNYVFMLALRNDLPLIEYCVLQLGLYSPKLLPGLLNSKSTVIKKETLDYIEVLYNTMELQTKLEKNLIKPLVHKKGLKI